MPLEKRDTGFRARLKVRQQRYDGPTRATEQEAKADLTKLEAVRSESSDVIQGVVRELLQGKGSSQARSAYVESRGETFRARGSSQARSAYVERRVKTFRARLKKDGHTYCGPQRQSEAEAEEDAQKLSSAADVSVMSLKQMEETLAASVSSHDDSLAQVVLEAMHCWLREGTTARLTGVSRVLRTRIRRAAPDSDQGRVFQAAQKLVQSHLLTEAVAMDVTAGWLQELGLQWRLDSGSRPRGTAGFEQAAGQTGLRNLGNSCYMNAVIQCLRACEPLRQDLTDETLDKGPLGQCLRTVMQQLGTNDWDYLSPFQLLHQLYLTDPALFAPGQTADCGECCSLFLQKCISNRSRYIGNAADLGPWIAFISSLSLLIF